MSYLKRAKQFKTKKRLGQNFLVDENVISRIISEANINENDTVVEIGAGAGFVTEQLIKYAKKVYAIEIDEDAIEVLSKLPDNNLEIIAQDVLKTDFSKFESDKIKVVANIPYYITSPILVHLLGEIDQQNHKNRQVVDEILLMVQYEVAKRMVANQNSPNKEYGSLSVLCNFWCETQIVQKVPAKCFYPAPKVDSAIVKLKVRQKPLIEMNDYTLFRRVVQAGFGVRRKTIKNALSNSGFNKDVADKALLNSGIDPSRRGETLSMEEFRDLSIAIGDLQRG